MLFNPAFVTSVTNVEGWLTAQIYKFTTCLNFTLFLRHVKLFALLEHLIHACFCDKLLQICTSNQRILRDIIAHWLITVNSFTVYKLISRFCY